MPFGQLLLAVNILFYVYGWNCYFMVRQPEFPLELLFAAYVIGVNFCCE